MRITVLQLLTLIGTLHIADPAMATVFGDDNRRQASADENPLYRRVGVITRENQIVGGTAWLSGECLITTNYHVAFFKERLPSGKVITSRAKRGVVVDFHVDVLPGTAKSSGWKVGEGKSFRKRVRAEVVDFGNYMPGDTTGAFEDYVHLKLDECIGRDLGFLEVRSPSNQYWAPSGELMVIGYPQDRWTDPGVTVESGCKAPDTSAGVGGATLDCSFMPGNSGSPVLELQGNGAYLVTGMAGSGKADHAEKYDVRSGSLNWMVLADVFAESIQEARYDIEPHTLSDELRKRIAARRANEAGSVAFSAMPVSSKEMKTSASSWRVKLAPDGRDAHIYYLQRPDVCSRRGCMMVVLSRPYVGKYSDTKIIGKFMGLPLPEFIGPARSGQWRTLYVPDEKPGLYREITFDDGEYRMSSKAPLSEADIREQGGKATGLKAQ